MCLRRVDPLSNAVANTFITLLWILAFVLVSWRTFEMVKQPCSGTSYSGETGISACVLYKALYVAAACGMWVILFLELL